MIRIIKDELLSSYSTFKIGGVADYLVVCNTEKELIEAFNYAIKNNIKFRVIGEGSNILFSDLGFRGLIIVNKTNETTIKYIENDIIVNASSGVVLDFLSKSVSKKAIKGLEWAVGIPGTLGGAILTNAGTSAGDIAKCLLQIKIFHTTNGIQYISNNNLELNYRTSIYKKNPHLLEELVILSAQLNLQKGNITELEEIVERRVTRRKNREPVEPNIGSIFKNPPNTSVRQMALESNLNGYTVGGASISEVAPSFIINKNNAKATDVLELVLYIKKVIFEKYKIKINLEIDFIGEKDSSVKKLFNAIEIVK